MDVPIEEKLVDGLAEEYAAYFKLDTTPQVGYSIVCQFCLSEFISCVLCSFKSVLAANQRDCNLTLRIFGFAFEIFELANTQSSLQSTEFFLYFGEEFKRREELPALIRHALRPQQVKLIEECIEENLTHLEEFCTMLDLIRNESNGYSTDLVPQFKAKKQQLRTVYAKIDKLLVLVDTVKVTVDSMEAELTKAEAKFNSSNKFSRFFSSLLGTSPDRSNRQVDSEFHSLNIFSTKGFFDSEPVVTPDLEENN